MVSCPTWERHGRLHRETGTTECAQPYEPSEVHCQMRASASAAYFEKLDMRDMSQHPPGEFWKDSGMLHNADTIW
jgi:hypothetical protein